MSALPLLAPRPSAAAAGASGTTTEAAYPPGACVARAVRGAGGAHARGGRRWSSGSERSRYARAERARQPAGAPPARARRRPGALVGLLHRALARAGRRACWASSRPAAPTCRSTRRYPPRAPGAHARGLRGPRGRSPSARARRPRCRPAPASLVSLDSDADALAAERRRDDPGSAVRARAPGLRHLHLGLDRPAQGRGCRAPAACANHALACAPRSALPAGDASLQFDPRRLRRSARRVFAPLCRRRRAAPARREERRWTPAHLAGACCAPRGSRLPAARPLARCRPCWTRPSRAAARRCSG